MAHYPQLNTGAVAQFPIKKHTNRRTIAGRLRDGRIDKLADPDAAHIVWDLYYSGLTLTEASQLEDLFHNVQGRLQTFVFLDPTSNLLSSSRDLTSSAWHNGALLTGTADAPDPWDLEGGTAFVNSGQIPQSVMQTISAPTSYCYSFSLYARATSSCSITLTIEAGIGLLATTDTVEDTWRRISCGGLLQGDGDEVTYRVLIDPGVSIQLAGVQAEPQPNPTTYKETTGRGGVYGQTRFATDLLVMQADGPGSQSASIRLISRIEA